MTSPGGPLDLSHQIELNEYVMSTSVCTVLGSRWRTEKQETESTKSRCWKIGLEVMLGAGKEKGGLALGSAGMWQMVTALR